MKYENIEKADAIISEIKKAEEVLEKAKKMKDDLWDTNFELATYQRYGSDIEIDLDKEDVERILDMLQEKYSNNLEEYKKQLESL